MFQPIFLDSIKVYSDSMVAINTYIQEEATVCCIGCFFYRGPHNFVPDFENLSTSRFSQVING